MPDPTNDNDIEALLENLFYMQQDADLRVSKDARRYRSALLALYAQRNELKAQCRKRFHSETIKDLLAERDALKQRVAELEARAKPVYITDGQRVESIDLRERLVCAALTGLNSNPDFTENADVLPRWAINQADQVLAAMRKGDANAE